MKTTLNNGLTSKQSLLISAWAVVEGFFLLVLFGLVVYAFPVTSPLENTVLPEWASHLKPEREVLLYRFFVLAAIVLQVAVVTCLRRKNYLNAIFRHLESLLAFETILLTTVSLILFKTAVYGDIRFWKWVIIFIFCLKLALKLVWPKVCACWARLAEWCEIRKTKPAVFPLAVDILVPFVIFVLVYIPDTGAAVAKIFVGDLFYHYDGIIMSAAWAAFKGNTFYVDTISQYGMGMPVAVGHLSRWLGGFSYENVLRVLIWSNIVFLSLYYYFVRYWLKDVWLAVLAVLLMVKFQMFHYGVADPFVWRHPSVTAVRYILEIPFLLFVLLHIRRQRTLFLGLAGVCAGAGIFHVTDTGVYMTLAWWAYLTLLMVSSRTRVWLYRNQRDIFKITALVFLPLAVAFVLFFVRAGRWVFTARFWGNFTEFFQYFPNGLFALPFTTHLEDKYFYGFFLSILVAAAYLFNLLHTGSLWLVNKEDKRLIFPIILSVYGLSLYHYHVVRSAHTNFLSVCIPLILVACFWLAHWTDGKGLSWRLGIRLAAVALAALGLFMTEAFRHYPNLLAGQKAFYEQERQVFEREYDFEKDAALIREMTGPGEKVPLFSSFETAILMAADRAPFFYYTPLVNTRYRYMRDFGGTYLFTRQRLRKTIAQLEREKPAHVFVERKLFERSIPAAYYHHYTSLAVLLTYLYDKYEVAGEGEYLLALERKQKE